MDIHENGEDATIRRRRYREAVLTAEAGLMPDDVGTLSTLKRHRLLPALVPTGPTVTAAGSARFNPQTAGRRRIQHINSAPGGR